MDKDQILAMAFELGGAISRSQELDALKNIQTRISNDQTASGLIMVYQQTLEQMDHKRNDGLDILPEELNHLESLQNDMYGNPMIQELIAVQEKFNSLMQGVNFAINQAINGETCTSDCTTCGCSCGM